MLCPVRYPFLLVDRVVEVELEKYAVGYKNVTVNDQFFNGHFPERAIMPGESTQQRAAARRYTARCPRRSTGLQGAAKASARLMAWLKHTLHGSTA
jgi:hypothetical protein